MPLMGRNETIALEPDAVYTATDVAKMLSCSRAHVYRMMETGQLKYTDIALKGSRPKLRIMGRAVAEMLDS